MLNWAWLLFWLHEPLVYNGINSSLKFSTNDLLLYLLSLAALLNFCTNSSIVFQPSFNLLNSATFIDCMLLSPNSFLMSTKNSSMFSYSSNLPFKSSSSMFPSRYLLISPACMIVPTIFVLLLVFFLFLSIYTAYMLWWIWLLFWNSLLNFCGLATLICILDHMNMATLSALPSPTCIIIACSTASYFCCCQTICFKLMSCWLIVYSGSSVVDNDSGGDSDAGGSN